MVQYGEKRSLAIRSAIQLLRQLFRGNHLSSLLQGTYVGDTEATPFSAMFGSPSRSQKSEHHPLCSLLDAPEQHPGFVENRWGRRTDVSVRCREQLSGVCTPSTHFLYRIETYRHSCSANASVSISPRYFLLREANIWGFSFK